MTIERPTLPYSNDALEPHISSQTLDFHYGKHHLGYYDKLIAAIENTDLAVKSLEELIRTQSGAVFNNAAQIWNHSFYWNSMKPGGGGKPSGELAAAIDAAFGDFASFQKEFTNAAATHFGSGWAWLVKDGDELAITTTHDAGCPLKDGQTPILTVDVWEHAYYLDYQNARPKYLESWWNTVNWDFAAENLANA